ncbi:MAG: cytochrome d ubiquinol oxidase subunit II [Candidatus Eremiobacteraeota bacterium]|nr:cytochrome d ubiquinol oxidase subunit II [Candidatus Eremiobacteraeota bacterium]
MDLHVFWFVLVGVLLAGYAVLDGFDLGVGIVHFTAKDDRQRRLYMNSIGPLWDGNEVWLVTFGGALFAAFPEVYATAFSAFYTPFMLLLCGLIFRAVSMEFRSKAEWPWWRSFWDVCFSVSCIGVAFLYGVAVGNSLLGMAIGPKGSYEGRTLDLLGFYPMLVGVLVVALFAMHGAIFLYLKNEEELQAQLKPLMWQCYGVFLVLYLFATIYTLVEVPAAIPNQKGAIFWLAIFLNVAAIGNIPRAIYYGREFDAFLSSALVIGALTFLFGSALFPNLMVSNLDPAYSLTVYSAASSESTLKLMRVIAFLGMPFVMTYTGVIYWVFRGKTRLDEHSY